MWLVLEPLLLLVVVVKGPAEVHPGHLGLRLKVGILLLLLGRGLLVAVGGMRMGWVVGVRAGGNLIVDQPWDVGALSKEWG